VLALGDLMNAFVPQTEYNRRVGKGKMTSAGVNPFADRPNKDILVLFDVDGKSFSNALKPFLHILKLLI